MPSNLNAIATIFFSQQSWCRGLATTLLTILMVSVLISPSHADEPFPYDMDTGREIGLILTSAAAFGIGYWLDQDFRPLIPEEADALDPGTINSLDRPATRNWSPGADQASDILVAAELVIPLGLNFGHMGSKQPLKVTGMYLETAALNMSLTYMLKNVFNRARPFVYNDNPDIPMDLKTSRAARKSFPSGHTANAFSSMVFFASVYEKFNTGSSSTGWVWAGCMAAATTTGVLRIAAGKHFTTDVLAGAALGALTGWLVPQLHEIDDLAQGKGPGPSITLSYGFGF